MNNNSPSKNSSKRKSLRAALRGILFKGRQETPDVTNVIGSGILRRDPSLSAIPTLSLGSSVPSFVSSLDDHYDTSIPDRFNLPLIADCFDVSSIASAVSMGHSLRPSLSMSSFKRTYSPIPTLCTGYNKFDFCPPHTLQYPAGHQEPTRSIYENSFHFDRHGDVGGHSGSGTAVDSCITRAASTLKIQTSLQSLRPEPVQVDSQTQYLAPPQPKRPSLMRKRTSVSDVRQQREIEQPSPQSKSATSSVRFADLPVLSRTPSFRSESSKAHQINHFASFCILDTSRDECPVSATSKDLRYIFEIGDEFCLNNHGCEGTSIDIVTGWDAQGNAVTHLVLFSPLVIPSSGRSRFMLASLVDVTDFINDAASLPELETISEESYEDDLPTPTFKPRMHSAMESPSRGVHYMLSAEDLLGGCFVAEPKNSVAVIDRCEDDIWLNIASEERSRSTGSRTPSNTSCSMASSIDDVVEGFMIGLQELYSDFFLLAKSPLDDNYYEICNVSPRVYASKDYVHGHLSRTSANDMLELSARLAYDEPFTMLVRWGNQGALKQMYCVPLFARVATTWVCFLIDPSLPLLW